VEDPQSNSGKFTVSFRNPTKNISGVKAYKDTYELFSHLLFRNCNLGFVSGGYRGIDYPGYGITRSGYELAKHFEKPCVVIMCNAGLPDSNQNSDALGLYGMHWGDDTEALSLMSDGAVFIAPFGAWTYIELALLTRRQKPVVIYFEDKLFGSAHPPENEEERKNVTDNWKNLGYADSDHAGIILLLKSKSDDAAKFKIDKNAFWGTWYHHFDKDKKYSVPIVNTHAAAAKYVLDNLESPCEYTKKARYLAAALDIDPTANVDTTLDRKLTYRMDPFSGVYETVNIKTSGLAVESGVRDFCLTNTNVVK